MNWNSSDFKSATNKVLNLILEEFNVFLNLFIYYDYMFNIEIGYIYKTLPSDSFSYHLLI